MDRPDTPDQLSNHARAPGQRRPDRALEDPGRRPPPSPARRSSPSRQIQPANAAEPIGRHGPARERSDPTTHKAILDQTARQRGKAKTNPRQERAPNRG